MREYVEKTWGWNEEFQKASFVEHLPWQRFQIITIGPIAVGGACILGSPGTAVGCIARVESKSGNDAVSAARVRCCRGGRRNDQNAS
jgi:hypothetical protein